MATRIFFNDDPEPHVILNYSDDFKYFQVSVSYEKQDVPTSLFFYESEQSLLNQLQSKEGLTIHKDGYKKINLRFRRSLFSRKWKVMYDDVEILGIEIS